MAVAFDHVIESFRNDLFPGYKTGAGVEPDLLAQFPLAEQAMAALGLVVWPMVEFEADDAIASAVARFDPDPAVKQIVIGSPDKDLAQLVRQNRIVCWDRRRELIINEKEVVAKYGVHPEVDRGLAGAGRRLGGWLPGHQGLGRKDRLDRAGQVQARRVHPDRTRRRGGWPRSARAARHRWPRACAKGRDELKLYKRLAELRTDVPLKESLADLEWRGARQRLKSLCSELGDERIPTRVPRWRTD